MYNRYIPQADGSYQRNRMPDKAAPPAQATVNNVSAVNEPPQSRQHNTQQDSIFGLFRNLLPKNIDTGDLIILLLVLLMSNDCEQDRNHALLTLALYFFL